LLQELVLKMYEIEKIKLKHLRKFYLKYLNKFNKNKIKNK